MPSGVASGCICGNCCECGDYEKETFYHGHCSNPLVTIDVLHYNTGESLVRQATESCGLFGPYRRRMEFDMTFNLP